MDKKQIAIVDVDDACSVTSRNGKDTVYFTVAKNRKGWWLSAIIDCDTNHSVDSLVSDDGPYASEDEAIWGGLNCATDWMVTNAYRGWVLDNNLKKFMRREKANVTAHR